MMTSLECTTKADEMDLLAQACATGNRRNAFASIALGWRTTAILALRQEQFPVVPPPA